jgi:histidinol-phosphate aminotransferase
MKSAIPVRRAVQRMRAYNPPLEGRTEKLRLDFNENPIGCSPMVRRALAKLSAASIASYPEQETVRRKAAKHFGVAPEELLLTNGTDEALSLVVNTFVEPRDTVLLVEPTYAMYRFYSELAGAKIVAPRYDAEICFPWNNLLAALRRGPKVFFLPNPNSPTGNLLSLKELRRILDAAKRTMVVIDEAYFEFSGVTVIPWIRRYRNLIVTRTFSKTCGLAGLRLGCIFTHRELAATMRKAQSPYPVNAAALVAADAAMKDAKFIALTVQKILQARKYFVREMDQVRGTRCFRTGGNFVLVRLDKRTKRVVAALARKGILVRDRSSDFGGEGYVRITMGTPAQMRRLVRELKKVL